MSEILDRRMLLKGAAATAAAMNPLADAFGAQAAGLQFDPPVPFTYELFKTQARDRAHGPYIPPSRPAPDVLQKINYEEWGKIRYRDDFALFADGPGQFPVTFFHLGLFFPESGQDACRQWGNIAANRLRPVLFRHAGGFARAQFAKGSWFRRVANPGSA